MYTLTIAIPTCNRASKLDKTLKNFINQILSNNLEKKVNIVISDNASTDNTPEIVKNIQQQYQNIEIKYSRNKKNTGWKNLKIAGDMANGEFVWICSDDDEYAENIITVLKEKIESNPQIPYMYIPAVQSKIESQGNENLYSFLLRGGMCSALISSNVFKTQNLKNTKAKSMTWYHMDIIFNMDMNSPIEILPKLINMPAENDENHWYTKAKNVLDYDTEIVNVVKKSKLPQDIKNVIYQHYKSCLPREIGRYRNKCKKDVFFVIKCMHRLKNIEYFQEEFVSLKNILFNKK